MGIDCWMIFLSENGFHNDQILFVVGFCKDVDIMYILWLYSISIVRNTKVFLMDECYLNLFLLLLLQYVQFSHTSPRSSYIRTIEMKNNCSHKQSYRKDIQKYEAELIVLWLKLTFVYAALALGSNKLRWPLFGARIIK